MTQLSVVLPLAGNVCEMSTVSDQSE